MEPWELPHNEDSLLRLGEEEPYPLGDFQIRLDEEKMLKQKIISQTLELLLKFTENLSLAKTLDLLIRPDEKRSKERQEETLNEAMKMLEIIFEDYIEQKYFIKKEHQNRYDELKKKEFPPPLDYTK